MFEEIQNTAKIIELKNDLVISKICIFTATATNRSLFIAFKELKFTQIPFMLYKYEHITSIKLVVSKSYSTIAIVMISTSIPLNKIERMAAARRKIFYVNISIVIPTRANGPKTINEKLMYTHGHKHMEQHG